MDLGHLQDVELRRIWPGEASDFTPWLLENASLLEDALGIDVELTVAEHEVGDFSLDLLGTDLSNDVPLIVENQLEATDHGHLGQLLTYAAGTDAGTIVWIAREFREEHREVLDWLNELSDDRTRFFGIRLRVLQIGDSDPAPFLELVANPNDWQKQIRSSARQSGDQTERQRLYQQFWATYLDRLRGEHPSWTAARRPPKTNWMDQPATVDGAHFYVSFARGEQLRHGLYIDSGDGETNDAVFAAIESRRDALNAAYGRELAFEALPNRRAALIADYSNGSIEHTTEHDGYIDWFFDAGIRLRRALGAVEVPAITDDAAVPTPGD